MDPTSFDDAILLSDNPNFEDAETSGQIILAPASRRLIEQIALNGLMALDERFRAAKAKEALVKDDEDVVPTNIESSQDQRPSDVVSDDGATVSEDLQADVGASIQALNDRIAQNFKEVTLNTVRELLFRDHFILQGAKRLKIEADARLFDQGPEALGFYLPVDEFDAWKAQHERSISTNFVKARGDYARESSTNTPEHVKVFECQRSGQPRVRKERKEGGATGKKRNRKPSIKQGCRSKITAVRQQATDVEGVTRVSYMVIYRYQHSHSLGSLTDFDARQTSGAIKATIRHLIMQGSTIQRAMQKLTMDYDNFMQILRGGSQNLSRDDCITYDDVYNEWHKVVVQRMWKDNDPVVSSIKWMQLFEVSGYFTYYNKEDPSGYFGFSSKWQLEQLYRHGTTVCFDGTHKIFGTKSNILVGWLRALQTKMKELFSTAESDYDFKPSAIITDQGNVEILAIKAAFPGVPIFYCAWHVLRTWERTVPPRVTGLDGLSADEKKAKKAEARADLRGILYARDVDTATVLINAFRTKWKNYKPLLAYLDEHYFGFKEREEGERIFIELDLSVRHSWMVCYRQDVSYCSIDTNDFIEPWHNTLKSEFFRDHNQRRLDVVIYILSMMALPHFQQKCARSAMGVDRTTLAEEEEPTLIKIAKQHIATRESRGYSGPSITQTSDTTLQVESFTQPDATYSIQIDFSKTPLGHIVSCSCQFFRLNGSCCKHISLVQIMMPQITFFRVDPWEPEPYFEPTIMEPEPEISEEPGGEEADPQLLSDAVGHLVQRFVSLEALRDKSRPIPHAEEIHSLMQQALNLFEPAFPRPPCEELHGKRRRQHY
ncbi:hypothetical protein DFQ27_008613 [Actinomortierella ambigua]|uniref:SWIM-type domain-containing protein n=1 Tax=Actinomortierella ambigua TaxID=1343610 RepID=A0A9P6QHZ1_9FUNG|nr:hypothetical protein DFQ27_008613 [Actinomortierella ambigua]